MSKSSEAVKRWRERTKARLVEAMGGKCVCCGYNRCFRALEFHHKDAKEKDVGIGNIWATIRSWERIVTEIRKCVMVCSVCHAEIHDGIRTVPQDAVTFDEKYATYKKLESYETDSCPVCGKQKPKHLITCSRTCSSRRSWVVKWDDIDLPALLAEKSIQQIADELGISYCAVSKRMKKLKILVGRP